jgi:F-type H+-transporting ATPase subunit b
MDLLKLLSANEIVAQTIAFLLLLAIMKSVFWKKVLKLLDDRKARIASEFKLIEDARTETERIRLDYEKRLATIDEAARAKMQEAISEGRRIADEIRENASKDGDKLVENARAIIKSDLAKAKEELKNEMVGLVIDTAGKVIQEKLSEEEDKKLVEYFLKEAEAKE